MLLGNLSRMGQKHNLANRTSSTRTESVCLILFCSKVVKNSTSVYCCCCILYGDDKGEKKYLTL